MLLILPQLPCALLAAGGSPGCLMGLTAAGRAIPMVLMVGRNLPTTPHPNPLGLSSFKGHTQTPSPTVFTYPFIKDVVCLVQWDRTYYTSTEHFVKIWLPRMRLSSELKAGLCSHPVSREWRLQQGTRNNAQP